MTHAEPFLHSNILQNAQWLIGEGAGSCFAFAIDGALLKVQRYSPQGEIECSAVSKTLMIQIKCKAYISF